MRVVFLLSLLSFLFSDAFSNKSIITANQPAEPLYSADTTDSPHGFVCILPVEPEAYPHEDWQGYLIKNLELDSLSVDTIPAGRYAVIVQFVVDERGEIRDVKTAKDPGYGLAERVVNVVSAYKERWTPAEEEGRRVKNYRRQPIIFVIEETDKECKEGRPDDIIL